MRTTTIDQVLGPVADAISEFLLANEEAELNDIPLGDMYPVAVGVAESVKGLLTIATQMLATTKDDDLKIDMPLATNEVELAAKRLVDSSAGLRSDPMNTVLRASMIQGAKGILSGTQKVLEAFDDYEVRKIVSACIVARQHVATVKASATLQEVVKVLQPTAQALVNIANLADKRIVELIDPWLKVELTQARETIRGTSTILVSAVKVYFTNIGLASARESRDLCADRLTAAINEVERIVKLKTPPAESIEERVGRLAMQRNAVLQSLLDIANAVSAQDEVALNAALGRFAPASKAVLDNAQAMISHIQDPAKREQIKAQMDKIAKLRAQVEEAARYALAHPEDPEAQRRLLELLKQLDDEFAVLENLVNEAAVDDINASFYALGNSKAEDSALARLIAAAKAGDTALVTSIAKEFGDQLRVMREAANQVAASSNDPEAVRAIYSAQKYLDDLYPQLVAAAKTVALNPNDPNAQEHLTAVVAEWESGVARLRDAVEKAQKPDEVVSATAKAIRADLSDFEKACLLQDANLLKQASKAINNKMQTVANVAQKEIENSDDPEYQQRLKILTAEMQGVMPELQANARALFLNPKDAAAQKALQNSSDKLVQKMDAIHSAIRDYHNPPDTKWATIESQINSMQLDSFSDAALRLDPDTVVVDEPAPQLLDPEEAKANPIKASAQELRVEADKWDSKDNPMIQMSQLLADKMALLAEFAKMTGPNSKKDLINVAKEIAKEVKVIEDEARRLAANCTDKRLKADLLATVDRISTQAQQLKILSTVKAANPGDMDTDQLLIGCATGLMQAVASTINSSHSASIRTFKGTANVAVAAVKWRRKVHAHKDAKPTSLASAVKGTAGASPAANAFIKPPPKSESALGSVTDKLKAAGSSPTPARASPAASPAPSPAGERKTIGVAPTFRTPGKK